MTGLPELRAGHARREQGPCRPVVGLDLPFVLLERRELGPCLLATAGVHGSEVIRVGAKPLPAAG